jgi:hypothetical protein
MSLGQVLSHPVRYLACYYRDENESEVGTGTGADRRENEPPQTSNAGETTLPLVETVVRKHPCACGYFGACFGGVGRLSFGD